QGRQDLDDRGRQGPGQADLRVRDRRFRPGQMANSVDTLFAVKLFERVGGALSATQASCVQEFPMADNGRPTHMQERAPTGEWFSAARSAIPPTSAAAAGRC